MTRILADTGGHRGTFTPLALSLHMAVSLVASRPGGLAWSVKRRRARFTAYRGMRGQANRAANAWSGPAGGLLPPITSRQARALIDGGSGAQRDAPAPASMIARAARHLATCRDGPALPAAQPLTNQHLLSVFSHFGSLPPTSPRPMARTRRKTIRANARASANQRFTGAILEASTL